MTDVSISRSYFSVLGCASRREFEDSVVLRVEDALADRGRHRAPIRLSSIARNFNVRPAPLEQDVAAEASLEFVQDHDEFVINLGRRCSAGSPRQATLWLGDDPSDRYRFTYAHELAHRFCFVRRENEWRRALEVVAAPLTGTEQLRAIRVLRQLEERICDTIAGRMLVPDRLLKGFVEGLVQELGATLQLHRLIVAGARHFGVSKDCWIACLQGAAIRKVVSLEPDFFFALVAAGGQAAAGNRSVEAPPTVIFPMVRAVSTLGPVRAPYPRMPVSGLGKPAASLLAREIRTNKNGPSEVDFPITLMAGNTSTSKLPVNFHLTGWFQLLRSWKDSSVGMVWGRLTQVAK